MGQYTAEAAAVLLEYNDHTTGVSLAVAASRTSQFTVTRPALHPDAKRTQNDLPEAAEHGAYGIAFLLVGELTGLKIIERSAKKTGIDYCRGNGQEPLFQAAARLEVSAIIYDAEAVDGRVMAKMKQTDASNSKLPAYVAVVEFGQPKSVFKRR